MTAKAADLSKNSEKALATIVNPLRERIKEFQDKVETTYHAETWEVLSLKEQIKLILETSHLIGNQADGLAKALRGDSQLLGRWGELALERILEAAGLTDPTYGDFETPDLLYCGQTKNSSQLNARLSTT